MKINSKEPFGTNGFFKLKNNNWLENQRIAGKCAATCLKFLEQQVLMGTSLTTLELSKKAEEIIFDFGCTPTFKGYKGFPEAVCISVNKELVHGIPKNYTLQDGDVVSFDLGATYKGAIADSAITCIYGNPKSSEYIRLIKACNDALIKGIEAIQVDKKIGVIGNAIYKYLNQFGYGVVTNYGGHGIDMTDDGVGIPHAGPFISNKSSINDGIRIQPGLVIAIEPMAVIGSTYTRTLDDGWTVSTNDIGSHWEHSVFVHEDHIEIITDRNNL